MRKATVITLNIWIEMPQKTVQTQIKLQFDQHQHHLPFYQNILVTSQKHAYIILIPLNPTFI